MTSKITNVIMEVALKDSSGTELSLNESKDENVVEFEEGVKENFAKLLITGAIEKN